MTGQSDRDRTVSWRFLDCLRGCCWRAIARFLAWCLSWRIRGTPSDSQESWHGDPGIIGKLFEQHSKVEAERHTMTKDWIESLIYIMALSQKQRENLAARMKMPEFLRRQLKESER